MMVVKSDQERVKTLLKDTITLLCKNGLSFKSKFSIEAVIGVTLDEDDVFLVSMNEIVNSDALIKPNQGDVSEKGEEEDGGTSLKSEPNHRRRKRKRSKTKHRNRGEYDQEQSEVSSDGDRSGGGGLASGNESDGTDAIPSKRLYEVSKQEPVDEDDSSKDIVYIKEELDEQWGTDPSTSQMPENLPDFSTASFSQADTNFGQIPGMFGDGAQSGWSSGMLPPTQQQQHKSKSWRMSNVSGQEGSREMGEGSSQQSMDSSQMGSKTNTCSYCQKHFSKWMFLKDHVLAMHGQRIFRYCCTECGKGFDYRRDLQGHMSWHTGVKEFKCPICGKEFRYAHHFKKHLNDHSVLSPLLQA